MSLRKSGFTMVMMWALIPLIVLGTLPRMGCICADGTHKFFCQRHLQGTRSGGCVCCDGRSTATDAPEGGKPAGAAGRHTCCHAAPGKTSSHCLEFSTGRPCRPVIDRLELLTAGKAALDLDRVAQSPLSVAAEPMPALVPCVAAETVRGELLPPPDLVITLGVLLI
ncbi:MAG: hypothetical protein ACM3U2_21760 [Deltaproteobacteria bacterium]